MLTIQKALTDIDWKSSEFLRSPASRKNGFRIAGFGPEGKGILVKFPRSQRVSLKEFKKENADSDYVLSSIFKVPGVRDDVVRFLDFMEDRVNQKMVEAAPEWVGNGSGGGGGGRKQKKRTQDPSSDLAMTQDLLASGQSSNYYMNDYGTLFLKASVMPTSEFYDEEGRELSMREFKEKLANAGGGDEEPSFYSCVPVLHFSHVWCDGHVRNGIKAKVAAVRLFKPTEEEVELMTSGVAANGDGPASKRQKIGGEALV